ncbi:hypothetical protein BpHYR1_022345 [Brachionus plicatilis]|uniref:Uncharacterized protein n=1 Tax=Brachionus plicatilis TaxID=10195 RepID=A0A3M7T2N0_BRAPC|nr:hypothetical protein BpHYR1_022345 [Brachionus plicatilis]
MNIYCTARSRDLEIFIRFGKIYAAQLVNRQACNPLHRPQVNALWNDIILTIKYLNFKCHNDFSSLKPLKKLALNDDKKYDKKFCYGWGPSIQSNLFLSLPDRHSNFEIEANKDRYFCTEDSIIKFAIRILLKRAILLI